MPMTFQKQLIKQRKSKKRINYFKVTPRNRELIIPSQLDDESEFEIGEGGNIWNVSIYVFG